jgi:hypothetical protein
VLAAVLVVGQVLEEQEVRAAEEMELQVLLEHLLPGLLILAEAVGAIGIMLLMVQPEVLVL